MSSVDYGKTDQSMKGLVLFLSHFKEAFIKFPVRTVFRFWKKANRESEQEP